MCRASASSSAWRRWAIAPPSTPADSEPADAERRDLLLRIGIAAFLSMNVMMFSLVVYASYFETHHFQFRPLHSLPADGAGHAQRVLLRGADPADRVGGRARRRTAHGIAARHGHPDGLRVQRGAGLSRRQPRLLRYGLRHRDPGAHRQSHRARRQGARRARAHSIAPPDAQQGAPGAGRPRALRLASRRCSRARSSA